MRYMGIRPVILPMAARTRSRLPINALTGQVESDHNHESGDATYRPIRIRVATATIRAIPQNTIRFVLRVFLALSVGRRTIVQSMPKLS